MVVVVDVPDVDRGCTLVLGGELLGVEELLGEDALVALGLPVVAWGERPDLLVPGPLADDPGEVA